MWSRKRSAKFRRKRSAQVPDYGGVLLLLVTAGFLCAQKTSRGPEFEVASVKLCPAQPEAVPGSRKGDGRETSPNGLHLSCQTLLSMIQWAYGNFADDRFNPVASIPLSGGPRWMNSDLFEIDAKAEMPQSWGLRNGAMLRSLLEERFQLRIRKEKKDMPVWAIHVAKGGPRLQPSRHDCITLDREHPAPLDPSKPLPTLCGLSRLTNKGWEATAVTMPQFAVLLSPNADRKVVDRTGLPGTFDIHLDLTAEDLGHSRPPNDSGQPADPVDVLARIRSALAKVGLRIDAARGPVESLVIESAERPSAN